MSKMFQRKKEIIPIFSPQYIKFISFDIAKLKAHNEEYNINKDKKLSIRT